MATTDPVLRARAMLGVAMRHDRGGAGGKAEAVAAARRDLAAAMIEQTITERLRAAGTAPLQPEQLSRLTALLSGGAHDV